MNMRYIQSIADISTHISDRVTGQVERIKHYQELGEFDLVGVLRETLSEWGFDKDVTIEELERDVSILNYIYSCRRSVTRYKESRKPSVEDMTRILERHMNYLESYHGVTSKSVFKADHWKYRLVKEAKACRYYIFQFSLPAWYAKLPDVIPTFEQKYGRVL